MRRHTIVIDGGNVGAAFAVECARKAGLADPGYFTRRDGGVQVTAYGPTEDKAARGRWVRACTEAGLTVKPAPWERQAKPAGAVARVTAVLDSMTSTDPALD